MFRLVQRPTSRTLIPCSMAHVAHVKWPMVPLDWTREQPQMMHRAMLCKPPVVVSPGLSKLARSTDKGTSPCKEPAHCSAFLGVAAELCHGAVPVWHWYWLPQPGSSTAGALQCMGLAVVAYHCFNHCRNGNRFSLGTANSILKQLLLDCRPLREVFVTR